MPVNSGQLLQWTQLCKATAKPSTYRELAPLLRRCLLQQQRPVALQGRGRLAGTQAARLASSDRCGGKRCQRRVQLRCLAGVLLLRHPCSHACLASLAASDTMTTPASGICICSSRRQARQHAVYRRHACLEAC